MQRRVKAGPTSTGGTGERGCTFWMAWLRKPRLNKAVATVGVLMVLSLSRVATFRVDMAGPF